MMADLDNKSEVLDYGENDDLENTKEDETMDTVEPETIKKVAEKEPNKIKGNEDVIEEDVFQVLDEEASDIVSLHLKFSFTLKLKAINPSGGF